MKAATALVLSVAVVVTTSSVEAAPPVLEYFYPAGGERGTSVTVTAGGKLEPWPVKAWTDSAELSFEPASASGTFTVKIGQSVALGAHLVCLYSGEGASTFRVFMVGEQREVVEAEPNDEVSDAQSIDAMPLTMNGQLEKAGDVDAFAVRLEAGACLVASLQGHRLGAPMDPMLHLFDEAGNEVAFAHDGFGLDPLLVHRSPVAGRFILRVSGFAHPPAANVRLTGGKPNVYRLSVSTGPFARWACPAAVKRGERRTVMLSGWNLGDARWDADATAARAGRDDVPVQVGTNDVPLRIGLSDGEELAETEVRKEPVPAAPFGVTGRIAAAREEDRYPFEAKKGEKLTIALRGGWVVSHFDPVLRVEDSSGKQLARDDDGAGGGGDARLEFAAPEDGTYHAVVSDLNRQGGEDYDYHLSVRKPGPDVTAAVAAHELRVAPGKSASIKVNVSRMHGHSGELVALAAALPAGVTSSSASVPAGKGGEVEITLSAMGDAKPFSGPIRVMLLGTDPEHPFARAAVYDLAREKGQNLIDATEAVWLTVLPPPAAQPAKTPEAPANK